MSFVGRGFGQGLVGQRGHLFYLPLTTHFLLKYSLKKNFAAYYQNKLTAAYLIYCRNIVFIYLFKYWAQSQLTN